MKKIVLLFFTCLFCLQVNAQRKSNFNTIDRKAGLFNNTYKNTYSASISYGLLNFNGDLSKPTSDQSTVKILSFTKQINAGFSLGTKVHFGKLYGSAEIYNLQYDFTSTNTFSNAFLAYSLLVKKQLNKQKESSKHTFRINAATGLGILSSEVMLHVDYFALPDTQLNFKTFYIPLNLDFEYFFSPHFGLLLATELNYCFSDKLDLYGLDFGPTTLTKMDVFTSFTAGICIKLE